MTHHDPHTHETVHEEPVHEHVETVETHHVESVGHGGGYFGSSYSMMGLVLSIVLIILILLVLVWAF
jgi:hypothetical protein